MDWMYAADDVVSDLHLLTVATGHATIAATHIHNRLARKSPVANAERYRSAASSCMDPARQRSRRGSVRLATGFLNRKVGGGSSPLGPRSASEKTIGLGLDASARRQRTMEPSGSLTARGVAVTS
jgi:hypothetical protein